MLIQQQKDVTEKNATPIQCATILIPAYWIQTITRTLDVVINVQSTLRSRTEGVQWIFFIQDTKKSWSVINHAQPCSSIQDLGRLARPYIMPCSRGKYAVNVKQPHLLHTVFECHVQYRSALFP
jgi:hypothetical protein